ncbi:oligosaccharide flippase family protein [Paenibacillus sp. 1P07SE]|uniref:oligosaccharide flippase family protein n=1 Tax=Paenibacillus sp. 1P07SE TaxID=3132209 RepID=UPI0039A6798F
MKQLFMRGIVINLGVMAINLLTGILSARYLGPEGRGILAIAMRYSGLFAMIFTIGLPGAVIFLGKSFPHRQKELFGTFLVLGGIMGVIGLTIGQAIIPNVLSSQPQEVVILAQIAMIAVPFGVMADGLIGTLQTLNKFGHVMLLRVLNPIGLLFIILVLIATDNYSVSTFIKWNLLFSVSMFLLPLTWTIRNVKPKFSRLKTNSKELLKKGMQIYSVGLVSSFGGSLDQLVLSLFLTTYTLGLYAVASSVGSILPSVVIGALGIYLFPKLMDLSDGDKKHKVQQLHNALLYGTAILSLSCSIILPYALPFVYGAEYKQAVVIGQILLMSGIMLVPYMVLSNFLSTKGKFHFITVAEIIGLSFGIGIAILLLKSLDGVGAAIGLVSGAFAKWAFLVYQCKRLGISLRGLFFPDIVSWGRLAIKGWGRREQTKEVGN